MSERIKAFVVGSSVPSMSAIGRVTAMLISSHTQTAPIVAMRPRAWRWMRREDAYGR